MYDNGPGEPTASATVWCNDDRGVTPFLSGPRGPYLPRMNCLTDEPIVLI